MNAYKVELLTVLGNAVFTPVARRGRELAIVNDEANCYADRAVSLLARVVENADGIRLCMSEIRKLPIEGWARTIFFMRLCAWWFPKVFPKFTPEFTASHFPVAECWVVKTLVEVAAESDEEAQHKVRWSVVVRSSAKSELLKDDEFFCRRLGVATRMK